MSSVVKRLVTLAFALLLVGVGGGVEAAKRFVAIGTGGVTGVYYPTGNAIARILNKKSSQTQIWVTVESTRGSVYNVNAIMAGELEFGLVQSDRQYQAFAGMDDWQNRPQTELRSIFALHPESVTVVAAVESQIKEIADLRGKVVNIGNPGSGQRGNAIHLLESAGIDYHADLEATEADAAEAAGLLLNGHIDAYIYTVGHPNGSVKEAVAGKRKVRFVPIPETIQEQLTQEHSYYSSSMIPVDLYQGVENDADVPSFGVKATFCTRAGMDEELVYTLTKEVFENLDEFKSLHPAFRSLTRENMLKGLSAPLHPGALRYYREVGLK